MAILQLPYNLSALFNFNEPDTNEGAMESSDEDFFDLFDFLPENTVTTNYLAKGGDRIQSLLRIKTRRTYSMNDFFKLFSRDQFWKKSNSRKDFTEYLIKTYWKKVINPFVNTLCGRISNSYSAGSCRTDCFLFWWCDAKCLKTAGTAIKWRR